jgi:hypothetical protein
MLMRQRDVTIDHDEPLCHTLPLEKLGNVLVVVGSGRAA